MAPHCLATANATVIVKMEPNEKLNIAKKEPDGSLPELICKVCGDRALGYNFRAITCESCKAFFRRNALASKEFRCPFTEQCEITVVTRRFCQKCRLEKCLSIGMNKSYIMSDEDKAQKRQKIAENRAKKRHNPNGQDDEVTSSKFVKREDNEDSNSSQNSKAMSPLGCDENNLDNSNHLSDSGYEFPSHNQTVSVIKNSNLSDSHLEGSICDTSNTFRYACKKQDVYLVNFDHCVASNTVLQPNAASPVSDEPISNGHHLMEQKENGELSEQEAKEEDNFMIRSMLTTATPNGESSRQFNSAGNEPSKSVSCDNTYGGGNQYARQNKADVARDILQDVERAPVEPNSIESILCEAIKLEFEAYTSLSQINSSSRELNDAERAKLNELIVANKALLAPLDDHMAGFLIDDSRIKGPQDACEPNLLGIINLTAVAIRRLIKMSKRINAFKNMCEEDQVALLKGGCTEMMILRSTMTYDCARDTWKVPHSQESLGQIKADVLKLAKGNIYEEHDKFIRTFDAKWRTDENIILIMCAIVLFTPDRPRVVHSDVIKLEQNSYYYLLRRYLESVYPGCEAKSTFLKLIQKIMELHKLADEVIGVYLDVNPSHVEPLLIEIFDLKQPH